MDIFAKEEIYLVLLDLRLKEENGFDLLERFLDMKANAIIIIMTAHSTIENSIKAIQLGAFYFITKPIENDQLLILLKTASDKLRMSQRIDSLEGHVKKEIIGETPHIKEVTEIIARVKDTHATILITGESGTGKELIAKKIHTSSNRADRPFLAINCAAIPGELLESELFGYRKGSFTGAYKDEIGIIRRADKGTILLDEIGDMDLKLQSKLLRFLQDKEVRNVGSARSHKVDVRVICITNKDLKKEVEAGNFREDLYYRINVINIVAPPLRDRIEDLKHLIPYFIDKYNISFNKSVKGIAPQAYDMLAKYPFRGNIRELENIIQRAVLLNTSDLIEVDSLYIGPQELMTNPHVSRPRAPDNHIKIYEGENMKQIERKVIEFALEKNDHNRKWTAESLGIAERTLRYKIKEYDL